MREAAVLAGLVRARNFTTSLMGKLKGKRHSGRARRR